MRISTNTQELLAESLKWRVLAEEMYIIGYKQFASHGLPNAIAKEKAFSHRSVLRFLQRKINLSYYPNTAGTEATKL